MRKYIEIKNITLLSEKEFLENKLENSILFDQTDVNGYWLRTAQACVLNGQVVRQTSIQNITPISYLGVKPVLVFTKPLPKGASIQYADQTFTVINDNQAVCDQSITLMQFNSNNAWGYKKSDVKKYLDDLFLSMGHYATMDIIPTRHEKLATG